MSLFSAVPPFSGEAAFVRHGFDTAQGDHIALGDPALLFSGSFERHGDDLWITRTFETRVVERYFHHDAEPLPLVAADGHWLSGRTVQAFTHGEHGPRYAAAIAPEPSAAIGRVESVDGTATAVRNGTVVLLHVGDFVYKGDAVATDAHGTLAVTFIDGTAFNLSAESKMVLDEMVYAPGGAGNKSLLSLVQGSINFVAGDVAHTGDMKVDTPVATMGIRGTAVHVEIGADNGPTHFSVMQEPNGRVGRYILYDRHDPTKVLGSVGDGGTAYDLRYVGGQVVVEPVIKNAAELQHEHDITKAVFTSFQAGAAHPLLRQLHEGSHAPVHTKAHGSAAETVTRPSSADALSHPKSGLPTPGGEHGTRGSPTLSHGAQHHGAAHDDVDSPASIDVAAADVSVIPTLSTLALVAAVDALSTVRAVPTHTVSVTTTAPVTAPAYTHTTPAPVDTNTAPVSAHVEEPGTPPTPPVEATSAPVSAPVEPGTSPTSAVEASSASVSAHVEPGTSPTLPVEASSAPVSAPVEPGTSPTPAVEASSAPVSAHVEPGTSPTLPVEASSAPVTAPVEPGTSPTTAVEASSAPVSAHVEPGTSPTPQVEASSVPVSASVEPGTSPTPAPVDTNTAPVSAHVEPGTSPTLPVEASSAPVTAPVEPATSPTPAPVEASSAPVSAHVEPGTSPTPAPVEASSAPVPAPVEPGTASTPPVEPGPALAAAETNSAPSSPQAQTPVLTAVSEVLHVGAGSVLASTAATALIVGETSLTTVVSAAFGSIVSPVSANGAAIEGQHGMLVVTDAGTFTYAAAASVSGLPAHASVADSFSFTIVEPNGASSTGSLVIVVDSPDQTPSVAYPAATVTEVGATGVAAATAHAILADPDGDAVTVSTAGWTQGAGGSWTNSGTYGTATLSTTTGDVAYALDASKPGPAHGSTASDSFAVTVSDGFGATTTGTATFAVNGADLAPTINYAAATITEAGATGVAAATSHASLADPDGDAVTVSTAGWTQGAGGSWTKSGTYGTATLSTTTGDVAYALDVSKAGPAHGSTANDNFDVTVADSYGATASGRATFHVVGADGAPTIAFTAASVTEPGATGVATATAHATLADPDYDAVTVSTAGWTHSDSSWIQTGRYGTATLNLATGDVSYALDAAKTSPAHGTSATDSFAVTASDDQGATSTAIASFTVNGVDHAPTIGYTAATITEGGPSNATAHAMLADADNDVVAVSTAGWIHNADGTWTQSGTYGIATLNTASGDVTYALDPGKTGPAPGTTGTDSFAVAVHDGIGASAQGLANFTIAAATQPNSISGFTITAQQQGNGQSVDVALSGRFAFPAASGFVTWDNGNDGHFIFASLGGNFSTNEVLGAGDHVALLTLSDSLHTITGTETVDINIGGNGNYVSSSTGGQSLLVGARDGHSQTYVGSSQADTLLVLAGSNKLTGGGGGDTFVFATGGGNGGFGNNEVKDFHASQANGLQDTIDLTSFHIASFNTLMSQATDHAAGVTLQLNGGSITLDHVAKAALHPDLFHL